MEQGENLSRVILHSVGILNFDINPGRGRDLLKFLYEHGVTTLRRRFDINVERLA
jgi:hypothetical protein